jgi:hypothetical protein
MLGQQIEERDGGKDPPTPRHPAGMAMIVIVQMRFLRLFIDHDFSRYTSPPCRWPIAACPIAATGGIRQFVGFRKLPPIAPQSMPSALKRHSGADGHLFNSERSGAGHIQ